MQAHRNNKFRRSSRRCTCRASYTYKPLGLPRTYPSWLDPLSDWWRVASFSSVLVHHRNCPLFHECQVIKQIGLRLSFCGPLLQGAMQATMSMTRGSGGLSINPMLAFSNIVPSNTGSFKRLDMDQFRGWSSAADLRSILKLKKQELLRLYQQGAASPHDVDEAGDSIIHVSP